MPTFESSTASPAGVAADLLIVPFFRGREPGPGLAEVARALGVDLVAVLKENHVSGKVGESFTFMINPARNGSDTGLLVTLLFPDGRRFDVKNADPTPGG